MVLIGFVLAAAVLRAVAAWVVRRRGRSLATAASEGLVDGFEQLGPTFVKLGQLIASSPSLFPAPLADACLRMLDEVRPFDPATVRRLVDRGAGPPARADLPVVRRLPAVGGVDRPGPRRACCPTAATPSSSSSGPTSPTA